MLRFKCSILRLPPSYNAIVQTTRFLLLQISSTYPHVTPPGRYYATVISEVSDPLRSMYSFLVCGVGMTTHHMVNNRRRPHRIPIVPAGPRIVWTIARAVNAPRKEDMIPRKRISRDGTRRGEARHGSPKSSTSFLSAFIYSEMGRLTVVVKTIVALSGVPIRCLSTQYTL